MLLQLVEVLLQIVDVLGGHSGKRTTFSDRQVLVQQHPTQHISWMSFDPNRWSVKVSFI